MVLRMRARLAQCFVLSVIGIALFGCSHRATTAPYPQIGFGDPRPLDWSDTHPAWNSSGTALAYAHQEPGYPAPRLRVLWLATGRVVDLTVGSEPAWSPRGDRIAYMRDNDIHVIDPVTGVDSVLVDDHRCYTPDWYPGGGSIVFARRALRAQELGAAGGVWLLTLATGLQEPLVLDAVQARWMPDGSGVVVVSPYAGSQGTVWDLGLFTFADNFTTRLTTDGGFKEDPTISPDGTRMAWAREPSGPSAPFGLFVGSIASGTGAQVDSLGQSPAWSPAGSEIAYSHFARVGNGIAIWLMNPDGTGKTQLTSRVGKLAPN